MLCDTVQCFAILCSENAVQILHWTAYWPQHTCACLSPSLHSVSSSTSPKCWKYSKPVVTFTFEVNKNCHSFSNCFLKWVSSCMYDLVSVISCVSAKLPYCGFKQHLVQQTLWITKQIDLTWNLLWKTKKYFLLCYCCCCCCWRCCLWYFPS